MTYYIISYYSMLYYIILHHITSYYIILYYIILYYIIFYYVILFPPPPLRSRTGWRTSSSARARSARCEAGGGTSERDE